MATDPKPYQVLLSLHRSGAEMNSDTHGPEPARLLEMQRRVTRVPLEQREIRVCQLLNFGREPLVKVPEFWIGPVPHRSLQRPSSRSRNASSPSASKRPAAASASNCRSQASASNSANQL